jgi:adenosine deaminase
MEAAILDYIINSPKAELHMHLEGSLEPDLMFKLAKKHNIILTYKSLIDLKNAYSFNNLQEFLDLYYQGMSVLKDEEDFYDLAYAYFKKANKDMVRYTEIFIDPQAHLMRNISLDALFIGVNRAIIKAKKEFNLDVKIIICFLRHLSENEALDVFEKLMDYRKYFIGIGLDSTELGHPPSKFKKLFNLARAEGLKLTAHAGEEGPSSYVWEALDILGVDRIDHGNAIYNDLELIKRISKDKIPLTMCPLSNQKLNVVKDLTYHQAPMLLDKGVLVTINSDDPAYFGGYINQNIIELVKATNLSLNDVKVIINNSLNNLF